jgi:hypothetical protein
MYVMGNRGALECLVLWIHVHFTDEALLDLGFWRVVRSDV